MKPILASENSNESMRSTKESMYRCRKSKRIERLQKCTQAIAANKLRNILFRRQRTTGTKLVLMYSNHLFNICYISRNLVHTEYGELRESHWILKVEIL